MPVKDNACAACGDMTKRRWTNGKWYCQECYDELEQGKIGPPPRNKLQGLSEHLTYRQALALPKTSS